MLFCCECRKSISGPHSPLGSFLSTLGIPLLVNIAHLSVNFFLCLNKYTFTNEQGNINKVWNNTHYNKKKLAP